MAKDETVRIRFYYFGSYHGIPCYAVSAQSKFHITGYEWFGMRRILIGTDSDLFAIVGRARQILEFNRTHKYCGQCGSETEQHEKDLALYCPACTMVFYPRISPCIIVLVTRGEELLLAKGRKNIGGIYTTLAGFVEAGETIEQAVHREVQEETGVIIGNLKYFSSQPWPFPHQLMLGFHAEYHSGEICIDKDEILDAAWWHYSNLPKTLIPESIAGKLISSYIEKIKNNPEFAQADETKRLQ